MLEMTPVLFAFLGGILPALVWLWFWLHEDSKNPEPRHLIALAFFAGMVTVAIVIPIQKFAAGFLVSTTAIFAAWSVIEEVMKYLVARVTVLRRRETNEPIDVVVYMVTVALGFAAVENTLFLISPLTGGAILETVLTGNLRFVGATLLHVLSSAVIGVVIAFAFYKPIMVRRLAAFGGVILAALLHTGFNFLILNTQDEHLFRTFALVWIGVAVMLALLEIVKRMRRR